MPNFTVRTLSLLASLTAGLGAQATPLSLRIDAIDLGPRMPTVRASLVNVSSAPVAVCRPLGGSLHGVGEPKYACEFERRGRKPSRPVGCGNLGGGMREQDLTVLAAGGVLKIEFAAPVLLTPGTWNATLQYSIAPSAASLGEKGRSLWYGKVDSPKFELSVPGPIWDEWIELPADQRTAHFTRELASKDAAVVGVAADALVTLSNRDADATCPADLQPVLARAYLTLLAGVGDEVPQRFDPDRHLARQLGDLLACRWLPDRDAQRETLRREMRRARGTGRQNLVSVLARDPVEADCATVEAELHAPSGDRETFRMCLEIYRALRTEEAAVAKAMAVLERTPPSPQFMEYAHALSHVTGMHEPSYIVLEGGGQSFPFEPEHFPVVKKQWSAWWKTHRASGSKK